MDMHRIAIVSIQSESKKSLHLENCLLFFKSSMNIKLLYILWKSVRSQIIWYHFCVVCVHAWMTRRHCLGECKNRLAPKLQCYICINNNWDLGVNSVFADPNNIPNKINHATHIKYQRTIVRVCASLLLQKYMQCISLDLDTFNSFSHSANPYIIHTVGFTLAQVNFCTLANNTSCSSKREHIPHKNGTKWFGIKHFFIRCKIIYCT